MPRFVLTYKGETQSPPPHEIEQIAAAGKILDRDVRAVLLETGDGDLAKLRETLPQDWHVEPERFYPVPSTREKIRKPAVEQ